MAHRPLLLVSLFHLLSFVQPGVAQEARAAAPVIAPRADPRVPVFSSDVPDWPVGAVADRDIVTTREFSVTDAQSTAQLRADAVAAVPSVFRYETWQADKALAEFDGAIADSRKAFRKDLEEKFGPLPLSRDVFATEEFRTFRRHWAENTKLYPPQHFHARAWGLMEDGDAEVAKFRDYLKEAMSRPRIRENDLDSEARVGPIEGVLIALEPGDAVSADMLGKQGKPVDRRSFVTLAGARAEMRESFPPSDRMSLRFVLRIMRANVHFEAEVTRSRRERAANAVEAPPRRFYAGEVVVRAGEVVTAMTRDALANIRAGLPNRILPPAPVAVGQSPAGMDSGALLDRLDKMFLYGMPVAIAILAIAITVLAARLPRRAETALVPIEKPPVVSAMRDETVQRLYGQKRELVEDQDRSLQRVASLEDRIAKLHPHLQAKLRGYEAKILELEARLAGHKQPEAEQLRRELADVRRERDNDIARATGQTN